MPKLHPDKRRCSPREIHRRERGRQVAKRHRRRVCGVLLGSLATTNERTQTERTEMSEKVVAEVDGRSGPTISESLRRRCSPVRVPPAWREGAQGYGRYRSSPEAAHGVMGYKHRLVRLAQLLEWYLHANSEPMTTFDPPHQSVAAGDMKRDHPMSLSVSMPQLIDPRKSTPRAYENCTTQVWKLRCGV
ncbi:hypothetical protein C8R44DRAFT_747196 [Mycena epipterygia]|nr:hypothetical protein C8R44DRAFT_747196 [Mycena epipterygia]